MNITRQSALLSISNRIKDATSLIIYDPYIFPKRTNENYLAELISVFPENLLTLLFIYQKNKFNEELRDKFQEECPDHIEAHYFESSNPRYRMHDRVWIVNGNEAFTTGSSFNSIGKNVSFMNQLPSEDLQSLLKLLVNEFGTKFKELLPIG